MPIVIHVEAQVKPNVNIKKETPVLRTSLLEWIKGDRARLVRFIKSAMRTNGHYMLHELPDELSQVLEKVSINIDNKTEELDRLVASRDPECNSVMLNAECYFYPLFDEIMQNNFEEDLPASFHTLLPSANLDGLWESLIFDSNIRLKLLNYVKTSLLFANQKVNPSIIAWNKVFFDNKSHNLQLLTFYLHNFRLFYCMARQGQERRLSAKLYHKSMQFDSTTATITFS